MGEPHFFTQDVTDDELAFLEEGRFPGWRLVGEAAYQATQGPVGALELHTFKRLWLENREGQRIAITLQRLPDRGAWRRVSIPGDDIPDP